MLAIKGAWSGQAFALATNNDSGGRKSRIRRSKEERKAMVELFIKKYQKKNDGNFPSLNLTHKEVGGSFYTVREIVREIIQENRVLAPPKLSLEEHDHGLFVEQHPLGSLSMVPEVDLSVSDRIHIATQVLPNEYHTENAEFISSLGGQLPEAGLEDGTIINGQNNHYSETIMEEVLDSNELLTQSTSQACENEEIVNGLEVLQENSYLQKHVVKNTTSIQHHDTKNTSLLSGEETYGPGPERGGDDEYNNHDDLMVDKSKEFCENIHMEPAALEILDGVEADGEEVEDSEIEISRMASNVVVETFPIRPVSRRIHDTHGESTKLLEAEGISKDEAIRNDKLSSVGSSTKLVCGDDEEDLSNSIMGERVVPNLQEPALKVSKLSPTSEHKASDMKVLASKDSPDGAAKGYTTEELTSKDSNAVGRKSIHQENASLPKETNNPTLDRINLDTWERASKKSTEPESNPLLALVKAFLSALVKFLTE